MKHPGSEANKTGRNWERHVEMIFKDFGAHIQEYKTNQNNGDMFQDIIVTRHVPYKSIYGLQSRSEFVFDIRSREFRARVEVKWQESSGSVDEKFPYVIANARQAYPESHIWIIIDGGGARPAGIEWLKQEAKNTRHKEISIFTLAEFSPWLRNFLK